MQVSEICVFSKHKRRKIVFLDTYIIIIYFTSMDREKYNLSDDVLHEIIS